MAIYLIEKGGNLVELKERPYDSEAYLQELLARYPSLLAGDQIEATDPRRWVLIARDGPAVGRRRLEFDGR